MMLKKKKVNKNKNKNEELEIKYNKNLTIERKKELIEEVDVILSKLTDKDIEYFEENADFTEKEINYMKKRKKLRASKRAIFYSRIRCDEETLNRIIQTTKQIVNQNKQLQKESAKIKERVRQKDEKTLASEKMGVRSKEDKIR